MTPLKATTAYYTVKRDLVALLKALPELAGCFVSYAEPQSRQQGKARSAKAVVYFTTGGGGSSFTVRAVSSANGRVPRNEELYLNLQIEVLKNLADQEAVDQLLEEIQDAISDYLATNPKPVSYVSSVVLESTEPDGGYTPTGEFYSGSTLSLRVRAHLI